MNTKILPMHSLKVEILGRSGEVLLETAVRSVQDNETLQILIPPGFFARGRQNAQLKFYDARRGVMLCQCQLSFTQLFGGNNELWNCQVTEVLHAEQRRQDVKIAIELPLVAHTHTTNGMIPPVFLGTISNLSAGGVYFTCNELLPVELELTLVVEAEKLQFETNATILRMEQLGIKDGRSVFGYGCKFVDLKAEIEAQIRQFVYAEELRRRKAP